jgi:hypothetical protein
VSGGLSNTASSLYATVGGGERNTASAYGATVPGGSLNTASGFGSFAAGRRAQAIHRGSFVWADSSYFVPFSSTAENHCRSRQQTSRIERLNNTLRQRICHLVHETRSFSKKRENHIGAIWSFVHHDNASLASGGTTYREGLSPPGRSVALVRLSIAGISPDLPARGNHWYSMMPKTSWVQTDSHAASLHRSGDFLLTATTDLRTGVACYSRNYRRTNGR